MKINGEECELVTDFATLRAGMIVVVNPCGNCGRAHCEQLIRFAPWHFIGRTKPVNGWNALPVPACADRWGIVLIHKSMATKYRVLYRVVDPKLAQTTTRKREAVRP